MRVVYCAQAGMLAGRTTEEWPVSGLLAQEDFWAEALRRHPQLAALRPLCRLACGGSYATAGEMLNSAEEIAVIPPVSGG